MVAASRNLFKQYSCSYQLFIRFFYFVCTPPELSTPVTIMSAVFLEILGCQMANPFRQSVRFASSGRPSANPIDKLNSLRIRSRNTPPVSFNFASSISRNRRPAGFWQNGSASSRRRFHASSFWETPRHALGRIEPKRVVVQIPKINRFESVWKPILVSGHK